MYPIQGFFLTPHRQAHPLATTLSTLIQPHISVNGKYLYSWYFISITKYFHEAKHICMFVTEVQLPIVSPTKIDRAEVS